MFQTSIRKKVSAFEGYMFKERRCLLLHLLHHQGKHFSVLPVLSYPDLHQLRAALLQQCHLPYPTGCTHRTTLNPTGIHPSTRMHCVYLVSREKEEKKKNQPLKHPPRTSTTQELRVELQIELIQWLRLS